ALILCTPAPPTPPCGRSTRGRYPLVVCFVSKEHRETMLKLFWGCTAAGLALAAGLFWAADYGARHPDSFTGRCTASASWLAVVANPFGGLVPPAPPHPRQPPPAGAPPAAQGDEATPHPPRPRGRGAPAPRRGAHHPAPGRPRSHRHRGGAAPRAPRARPAPLHRGPHGPADAPPVRGGRHGPRRLPRLHALLRGR